MSACHSILPNQSHKEGNNVWTEESFLLAQENYIFFLKKASGQQQFPVVVCWLYFLKLRRCKPQQVLPIVFIIHPGVISSPIKQLPTQLEPLKHENIRRCQIRRTPHINVELPLTTSSTMWYWHANNRKWTPSICSRRTHAPSL